MYLLVRFINLQQTLQGSAADGWPNFFCKVLFQKFTDCTHPAWFGCVDVVDSVLYQGNNRVLGSIVGTQIYQIVQPVLATRVPIKIKEF